MITIPGTAISRLGARARHAELLAKILYMPACGLESSQPAAFRQ